MAKFGQAFINQLTNPGYGQGLFNLGSAIGSAPAVAAEKERRQGIMDQLRSMDPLETADFLVEQAKTPEQLLKAKEYKSGVQNKIGQSQIDRQLAIINGSSNPEQIMAAQNQLINVANNFGIKYSEYADAGQKRIKNINDNNWTLNQRATEQTNQINQKLVDNLSNAALNQSDPLAYINANLPEDFAYLKDNVLSEFNTKTKAVDSFNETVASGKLSQSDLDFFKSNPDILESNPALKAAYQTYTSNSASPSMMRSAAKNLSVAVSSEKQRQRDLETSESFAKENASNAVNFILGKTQSVKIMGSDGSIETVELPSGTGMFEDPDIYDAVQNISEDKDKFPEFQNRLANVYRLNPQARPVDAVKIAFDNMNINYSGEALTEKRREDIANQANDFEEAINSYYLQEGIDPRSATEKDRAMAELAVSNTFQEVLSQERESRMQRVQDIRSQAPSRGDLSVFR